MPLTTYIDNEDSSDYCDGSDTELLVSTVAMDSVTPNLTQYSVDFYNGGVEFLTTLTLGNSSSPTPLPIAVAHGRRLQTADGRVYTVDASSFPVDSTTRTRYVPAGANSLPIYPIKTYLAANSSIVFEDLLPLYSSNEASFKLDGDEINWRNFRSALQQVGRKTKQKASFSCGGEVIKGEKSLALIRNCANSKDKKLKIQYIPPDGQAVEFQAYVKSDMRDTKIDAPYTCKFDFIVASPAVYIDLNPS